MDTKKSFIGDGIEDEVSDEQVAKMARDNHIWLDGFSCIHPTDKFLIELGYTILQKLNEKDKLLHKRTSLANMLYLSINKS